MTILTQSHGGKTRRCDGTCHNAKKPKCACICGGRYHGKNGVAQELLTRDWLGDDRREKKAAVEVAGGNFEAVISGAFRRAMETAIAQPELFPRA